MKKELLKLLDVNIKLFDGEGTTAPATVGEGSQVATAGVEKGVNAGATDQNANTKAKVIYGKQDIDNINNDVPTTSTGEGGPEGENVPGSQKETKETQSDPETLFEQMIKGDYKEQFDKRVQDIINKRFKETKHLQESLQKIEPVLELLKDKYDVKDTEKLLEAMENEAYEELAYKNDMTPEQFKKMKQLERENQDLKFKRNSEETQMQIQRRVENWYKEANELKGQYPDFDLKVASKNSEFLKLLQSGVSVKAAYEAAFFEQILNQKLSQATKQAENNAIENIKAKKQRITENGTKAQPGVIVKSSVSELTAKDRAEIARRVAMGEKINF